MQILLNNEMFNASICFINLHFDNIFNNYTQLHATLYLNKNHIFSLRR